MQRSAMRRCLKGLGGFPTSTDGSFSARHTAAWAGFFRLPTFAGKLRTTEAFGRASNEAVFPRLFQIGSFSAPTYGFLVSSRGADRSLDQRSEFQQAGD